MSDMQPVSTTIIIISMLFGNLGVQQSIFQIDMELVVLASQQIQSLQMTQLCKPENMEL